MESRKRIETILNDLGIQDRPAFDFEADQTKEEGKAKILEDNSRFLPGHDELNTPLASMVWGHEASKHDQSKGVGGKFSVYSEDITTEGEQTLALNFGPGLRFDGVHNRDLYKKHGLDVDAIKKRLPDLLGTHTNVLTWDEEQKLRGVFNDRLKQAKGHAMRFVMGAPYEIHGEDKTAWKHLTQTEQDVLTDMAYNMGLGNYQKRTGLRGFRMVRKHLLALARLRQAGADEDTIRERKSAIVGEMLDSKWARQTGTRVHSLLKKFMGA